MKKTLSALVVALALAVMASAQDFPVLPGVTSLEADTTAGLFTNNIDNAFGFGGQFGTSPAPFIFAGVSGNPQAIANNAGASTFMGGYYQPGGTPFSIFSSASVTAFSVSSIPDDTIVNTYSNDATPNTTGTVTTTTQWISRQRTYDYSVPSMVSALDFSAQGLVRIGGITTGLVFRQQGNWSGTDGNADFFLTLKDQRNYDSTTGASANATAAPDYMITEITNNIDSANLPSWSGTETGATSLSNETTALVPFALATGKIRHAGFLLVDFSDTDQSGSYSYEATTRVNSLPPPAITDEYYNLSASTNNFTIRGLYQVTLPGFFLANRGGELTAGLSVRDLVTTQAYEYSYVAKNYSTAGTANSPKTAVDGSKDYWLSTYDPANLFDISATVAHSLPVLASETLKFSLKPTCVLQFVHDGNSGGDGILASTERFQNQTLNSSFAYDTTTGYVLTQTAETGTPQTQTSFGFGFNVPTAFEIQPAGWIFGISAGATPKAAFNWTANKAGKTARTTTTTTYTNSTTSTTQVTSTNADVGTSSTEFAATFSENHSVGVFFPLGKNMRLDVQLNGANLLAFDDLTCQLYIPLQN